MVLEEIELKVKFVDANGGVHRAWLPNHILHIDDAIAFLEGIKAAMSSEDALVEVAGEVE